ncbi:MAG: hypothetical protein HRT40_03005 [Campylobacteraceae bacterium]|nr:hypothetical protein [Campylobacteraceae bacterium]
MLLRNIIFLLFSIIFLNAQWLDDKGNKIPNSSDMQSQGEFSVRIISTDNKEQLLKNWNTNSKGVKLPTIFTIERNKEIDFFILFGGASVDKNQNVNVLMRMTVYKPNGSIYINTPIMEVWSNKPMISSKTLGLSVDYLGITIEDNEVIGKYRIEIKVLDVLTSKAIILKSYFTVIEAK